MTGRELTRERRLFNDLILPVLIKPVLIKGYPKAEDLLKLEKLADLIYDKHQNDQMVKKGA